MNRRHFLYQLGATGFLANLPVPGVNLRAAGNQTSKPLKVPSRERFRGIGINYFDLFQRLLREPAKTQHLGNLERLKKAHIPFARFACCGFWPSDWDLYLKNRGDYFHALDQVIHVAEQAGFGLIPSLFWLHSAVPDLVHEPMQALGDSKSKSVEFILGYTREVVTRYRNSAAIWGWELGNEYNLVVDLPNAASQRPPVHPTLKTALQRSEQDELRSSDLASLSREFGRVIRQLDSETMIITGNAAPRPSAWHNSHEHSWKTDTRDQFQEVLLRDNPEPIDTLSIHLYPEKNYPGGVQDAEAFLRICMAAAKAAGKKLFVGEFGIPRSQNAEQSRADFEKMLAALVKWEVPLAALWVYDFHSQETDWNVTFENERAFMLEMIGKANVELGTVRKS